MSHSGNAPVGSGPSSRAAADSEMARPIDPRPVGPSASIWMAAASLRATRPSPLVAENKARVEAMATADTQVERQFATF